MHKSSIFDALYWLRVSEFLEYWPREQLLLLLSDDFSLDLSREMNKLGELWGFAQFDFPSDVAENKASGEFKPSQRSVQILTRIFIPHLLKLIQLVQ